MVFLQLWIFLTDVMPYHLSNQLSGGGGNMLCDGCGRAFWGDAADFLLSAVLFVLKRGIFIVSEYVLCNVSSDIL